MFKKTIHRDSNLGHQSERHKWFLCAVMLPLPPLRKIDDPFYPIPNRFIESHSPPNFSDLIEGLSLERSDEVNRKLKTFYDSCMDVETIRTKGFIPGESTGFKEEAFKEIFLLEVSFGGSMAQMRRSRFSPAPVGA